LLLIAQMLIGLGSLGVAQAPERIARVVQHYSAKDGFSGTVTFATAGKVIFRHGYGFANHTQKSGFDEHTRFNIGLSANRGSKPKSAELIQLRC
jgi:hypothetical protein